MENLTPEHLAAYALLGTLVCTSLEKCVAALRSIAAVTASKRDDNALDEVENALESVHKFLGLFSVATKSAAPVPTKDAGK